jgi:hypothetical protein
MRLTPQQIQQITDQQMKSFLEEELPQKFTKELFENIADNPFLSPLGRPLIWSIVMSLFRSQLGHWFEGLAKALARQAGFEVIKAYDEKRVKEALPSSVEGQITALVASYQPQGSSSQRRSPPADDRKAISFQSEPSHSGREAEYEYDLVLKRSTSAGEQYYLFEVKTSDERITANADARAIKERLLRKYVVLVRREQIPPDNAHLYFTVVYTRKKIEGANVIRNYFASDEIMSGAYFWSFICGAIDEDEAVSEDYFNTSGDAYDHILMAYRRRILDLRTLLENTVDKWSVLTSQQSILPDPQIASLTFNSQIPIAPPAQTRAPGTLCKTKEHVMFILVVSGIALFIILLLFLLHAVPVF